MALSIVAIIIGVIIFLFFGQIMSFVGKILFGLLIVAFAAILFFGISMDQVIDWVMSLILLTF